LKAHDTDRLFSIPAGVVALPTDRVIPTTNTDSKAEDALLEEPVKALEAQATFDDFVVWGHEDVPDADEAFVKGVEEWIQLAEAVRYFPLLVFDQPLTHDCSCMATLRVQKRHHNELYLMIEFID
jgi:Ribonuclease H2 non-catalytic subunit (Ylr154p-like)